MMENKSLVRVPPNHKASRTTWRSTTGKTYPVTVRKIAAA